MPKICYVPKAFHGKNRDVIEKANVILEEYAAQGLIVTLRQLYYQFVARGFIENTFRSYKRLQDTINDARLAGHIDWLALEDRTRTLDVPGTWDDPADIVETCARGYRENLWADQDHYVEVWVEKEALSGVIQRACELYRTPWLACRGYISQSEAWRAGQRMTERAGKRGVIIHLGDHDPSGIDMTRDNQDRLTMFAEEHGAKIERVALNIDQVRRYNPPPNPAKETDSRCEGYIREFGRKSWELDALEPKVLVDLIQRTTAKYIDTKRWKAALAAEKANRDTLLKTSEHYDEVAQYVKDLD